MGRKPRLLDLFCGAGGCSMGYSRAGFEVVGVDINHMPRYPFEFHQGDALEFLVAHGSEFDAIHASPPCQRHSSMMRPKRYHGNRDRHPDLIGRTQVVLLALGLPYIIENVPGAPLNRPIMLCGAMFGLRVYRHRMFESSQVLLAPGHRRHVVRAAKAGKIPRNGEFWSPVGCFGGKADAQAAMGINWMKTTGSRDREIAQAIPPAYTEYLGRQLIQYVQRRAAS